MDVCILNCKNHSYRKLYECIDTPEHAELLAQLAMIERKPNDDSLIFIFPSWNRGINNNKEEYEAAKKLAEEYKTDNPNYIQRCDNDRHMEYVKKQLVEAMRVIDII